MPGDDRVPNQLVFFSSTTNPTYRRRRLIFAAIFLLASLSLIWPVYPLFSRIYPMIFSLPFSMAWLVIWLTIVMAGLFWLYRSEKN